MEIKPISQSSSNEGVIVDGINNCLIKFSKCCAPLPGDEIIGFITRGHGVSIHKMDCNNVPKTIDGTDNEGRWINAHWASNIKRTSFISTLLISCIDRDGILAEVTLLLYNMHVPLHAVNARRGKNGNSTIQVTVSTENVAHLKSIVANMEKLSGVYSVERLNQ